jgi:hypothetical protein
VRRRWRIGIPVLALVTATLLATFGGVLSSREQETREAPLVFPARGRPVAHLHVFAQQFDVAAQQVVLRMDVAPMEGFGSAEDGGAFAKELRIWTDSPTHPMLTFRPKVRSPELSLRTSFERGSVSAYPLDEYVAQLRLQAEYDNRPAPLVVTFVNADALFDVYANIDPAKRAWYPEDESSTDSDQLPTVTLDMQADRATGTLVLAWFMMLAVWALALVVLGGAAVLVARRAGLTWEAYAWMAATLFALVGLRQAAPGNPPTGALIDYAAFYWAEALVALGLVASVVSGLLTATRRRTPDQP